MNTKKNIAQRVIREIIQTSLETNKEIKFNVVKMRINNELKKCNRSSGVSSENQEKIIYSDTTIRRIMVSNDLVSKKGSVGGYIYSPINSILGTPQASELFVNDYLYYTISPSSFAPQIASALNQEFKDKHFKAVTIEDVLICMYIDRDTLVDAPETSENKNDTENYFSEEDCLSTPEIKSMVSRLINIYRRLDSEH